MAEGYLKSMIGKRVDVYSAGIETHGVNPKAIAVMAEEGIDLSDHTSNNIAEYDEIDFDWVITVCDHAQERCPVFIGKAKVYHYNFPDPAKATGTPEEVMASFRSTRDLIKAYLSGFCTRIG